MRLGCGSSLVFVAHGRVSDMDIQYPKGLRTPIIGFQGPNTSKIYSI